VSSAKVEGRRAVRAAVGLVGARRVVVAQRIDDRCSRCREELEESTADPEVTQRVGGDLGHREGVALRPALLPGDGQGGEAGTVDALEVRAVDADVVPELLDRAE
jgi:hypothetical protein